MVDIRYAESVYRDLDWLQTYGKQFSEQQMIEFEQEFEHCIVRIRNQPLSYPLIISTRAYRSCRLKPHYRIYYEYKPEQNLVEIVQIFDSRQHPDKLKL